MQHDVKHIINELSHLFGHEVGVSDWFTLDQDSLDGFAVSTGDDSWMHTDVAKTAADSPFGMPIAQSFLVLSHLTTMVGCVDLNIPDIVYRQNYGFDRLRILQPVRVGQKIRGRFELKRIDAKDKHGMLIHFDVSVEIENDDIPALVAEWLAYVRVGKADT